MKISSCLWVETKRLVMKHDQLFVTFIAAIFPKFINVFKIIFLLFTYVQFLAFQLPSKICIMLSHKQKNSMVAFRKFNMESLPVYYQISKLIVKTSTFE